MYCTWTAVIPNILVTNLRYLICVISNGSKFSIVGRTSKEVGRARASEILLACFSKHLHRSVRERLLCELRVCNNSIDPCTPKQHNFLKLWQSLQKLLHSVRNRFWFRENKLWNLMFHQWENLQNVRKVVSSSIFSLMWLAGSLSVRELGQ